VETVHAGRHGTCCLARMLPGLRAFPLRQHTRLAVVALGLSIGVACCGGTTASTATDAGLSPDAAPPEHRPTGASCDTTRPPGIDTDAGAADSGIPTGCTSDADCTQGKNGRCSPPLHNGVGNRCTYDECFVDDDCGAGKACLCGTSLGTTRSPSTCLPANCRSDADCGAGESCSPTLDTSCGPYDGIQGFYCHTPGDSCTSDAQCTMPNGYCAWQPMLGKWACASAFCVG
jgi:Cys-rich repeat protein